MKVVVSSEGQDLRSSSSTHFGRCPTFLFVDTESMQFEPVTNTAANASGGAGVQAAQLVTRAEARAVITGKVGPKAMQVLQAASIPVYLYRGGTVREAVEDFKAGKLPLASTGETEANPSREQEVAALENEVAGLRRQLTSLLERIERLQEES